MTGKAKSKDSTKHLSRPRRTKSAKEISAIKKDRLIVTSPDQDESEIVRLAEERAAERRKRVSSQVIGPVGSARVVIEEFGKRMWGEMDFQALNDNLAEKCGMVNAGNLGPAENMLFLQAKSLETIFSTLACRAMRQEFLEQFEVNLKLALRAQSQCRATLETLAALKNPPVVFAKQANIANGPQQVNNGNLRTSTRVGAHAGETGNKPNELLEHDHGQRLDTGATGTAGRSDKAMAAMEVIDGASHQRRQGGRQP